MEKFFCSKLSPRISGPINFIIKTYEHLAKFPKRPLTVYAKRFTSYTAKQTYPNASNQTCVLCVINEIIVGPFDRYVNFMNTHEYMSFARRGFSVGRVSRGITN